MLLEAKSTKSNTTTKIIPDGYEKRGLDFNSLAVNYFRNSVRVAFVTGISPKAIGH